MTVTKRSLGVSTGKRVTTDQEKKGLGSSAAPTPATRNISPDVTNPVPLGSNTAASQISTANKTSKAKTVSPVITSKSAKDDYNTKYAAYQSAIEAMNQQTDINQQKQAQMAAEKAQQDLNASETNLKQQGIDIQKTQADAANIAAQAKLAAANGLTSTTPAPGAVPQVGQTGVPAVTPKTSTGQSITPSKDTINYAQGLMDVQDERSSALSSFLQTANSMIVGMQASETALVNATTQQFQNIMKAQEQSNASELGAAKVFAARTGQEYTPTQAAGTIANIINQGNQRLSDINSKMASTIADLELNFSKEQYSLMNSNFEKLDKNFTERMNTFKEIHDAVAKDASEQQKAITDARDFEYKQKQDTILNNLNSAKFTYQQKQDAIDNAFKSKQISESQRHNLAMEAISKEPTPAEKKATEESLKNAKASIPVMQDKIKSVDSLKEHPGLETRVGTGILSRSPRDIYGTVGKALTGIGAPLLLEDAVEKVKGSGQDFAGQVHKLTGGLTLQNLIDAKARGATFGALSEGELNLLASSASAINDWEIKDSKGNGTGIWNIDEKSFKKELDNIKTLTNRALLLSQQNIVSPEEEADLDSRIPDTFDPSAY